MRAGKRNTPCRFEVKISTQDPTYHSEKVTWRLHAEDWCEVLDVLPSRAEGMTEQLVMSRRPARVRLNYRDDIDPAMRVVLQRSQGEVVCQIISGPAEIGTKDGIELMVEVLSS